MHSSQPAGQTETHRIQLHSNLHTCLTICNFILKLEMVCFKIDIVFHFFCRSLFFPPVRYIYIYYNFQNLIKSRFGIGVPSTGLVEMILSNRAYASVNSRVWERLLRSQSPSFRYVFSSHLVHTVPELHSSHNASHSARNKVIYPTMSSFQN